MLAAFFTGDTNLELKEVPKPQCPQDGLLVKVTACAICGTDLKILKKSDVKLKDGKYASMKLPRITGHELSGRIAEVGREVENFNPGEKVIIAPTVPCGVCHYCLKKNTEMCERLKVVGYDWDGGFSEFIKVEKEVISGGCVVRIPEGVDEEDACLTEPFSCALNSLELTPVERGDTVVIIGSGPLGGILADLAKWKGARQVILVGRSETQLDALEGICRADIFINSGKEDLNTRVKEITYGRGADVIYIACASREAQEMTLNLIARRGRINLFAGLPKGDSNVAWDTNLIHYKECSITGTHGSRPEHVQEALQLMKIGVIKISRYISHRFPLREINQAIEIARSRGRLKVIIKP